jgi:hypothetical protein
MTVMIPKENPLPSPTNPTPFFNILKYFYVLILKKQKQTNKKKNPALKYARIIRQLPGAS